MILDLSAALPASASDSGGILEKLRPLSNASHDTGNSFHISNAFLLATSYCDFVTWKKITTWEKQINIVDGVWATTSLQAQDNNRTQYFFEDSISWGLMILIRFHHCSRN